MFSGYWAEITWRVLKVTLPTDAYTVDAPELSFKQSSADSLHGEKQTWHMDRVIVMSMTGKRTAGVEWFFRRHAF